jgi:hypothetical protein
LGKLAEVSFEDVQDMAGIERADGEPVVPRGFHGQRALGL